jgi:hypothetical protein
MRLGLTSAYEKRIRNKPWAKRHKQDNRNCQRVGKGRLRVVARFARRLPVSFTALTAQSGMNSRRQRWFGAPVQSHRIKWVPSLGSPPATSRHLPPRPRMVPSRAGVQL